VPHAGASALGRVEGAAPASLAGVRVLLVSDSDEREAFTSAAGAFEFGRLPPGEWRVTLDPASVPAGYAAAQAGLAVVTLPGGTVGLHRVSWRSGSSKVRGWAGSPPA